MIACPCEVCNSKNEKDKRLRSSILVQSAKTTLIVDTGPDLRTQLLKIDLKKLDAVLFTHPHKDHIAGLDDVKAFNYFMKKPMQLYANALTEEAIRREFYYAFTENKYPGIPELKINLISSEPFMIGDIPIIPILTWHLNMPVFGFRFGEFTYITDANRIDDEEKEKVKGSEVIVLNALRKQSHIAHFTLGEAIDLVQELEIPTAYFTHISHQLGLHDEVESELPDGIHLAYDGLELNFKN
jgi:phosphoribosyl 1,2-cyclic phosphate phosphodiesterase